MCTTSSNYYPHKLKEVSKKFPAIIVFDLSNEEERIELFNWVEKNHPAVSDFAESILKKLKEGKTELMFGTSETRTAANNETIADYFHQMNP